MIAPRIAAVRGRGWRYPGGGVVLDAVGNLFGTAVFGGANNLGVVYQLTP